MGGWSYKDMGGSGRITSIGLIDLSVLPLLNLLVHFSTNHIQKFNIENINATFIYICNIMLITAVLDNSPIDTSSNYYSTHTPVK